MGKAIGLVRVSTKVQELESQSEKVKQAIINDGFEPILVEDKESGSKLDEMSRSGLNKMKHYIETEDVSAVYVYEISRISRKEHVLYSIREYLREHKVQLVCLTPYFRMFNEDWSTSDQAAFTFSIFATLSSQETYIRTSRMMRGKEKKKQEGKLSVGKPLFGYTVTDDHVPIPHPKDSIIVREIFERYADGESSGSIGKDLWLRKALHTKSTKCITYQTYVSWAIREGRYANMTPSIYPPIISKELFNKCQRMRDSKPDRFKRKGLTKECYPLQGYIFNEDGYVLIPSITNNRYVKMNGTSKALSVNMKAADALSMMVMNKYLQSGVIEVDRQKRYEELSDKYEKDKVRLDTISFRISQLNEEINRINRRIISGRMSEVEGDAEIDQRRDEIKHLEDLEQELTYNLSSLSNNLILLANPLHLEVEIPTIKNNEQLKEAVHKYIKKIVVTKIGFSNYRLVYHFNDGSTVVGEFLSLKSGISYKVV